MTRATQKQRERSIVEFYLQAIGATGRIIGEQEPPDILLEIDGRVVGIEVTEYHQPQRTAQGFTRRQVEEAWQKIRAYVVEYRRAERALESLGVRLQFKDLRVPNGK